MSSTSNSSSSGSRWARTKTESKGQNLFRTVEKSLKIKLFGHSRAPKKCHILTIFPRREIDPHMYSRGFKAQVLEGMTALIARTTATQPSKQASTASTHDCYKHNNYSYPRWWGGGVWRVAPWEGKESATNRAPPSSVSQRLGHTWQPVSCLLSNTSRFCITIGRIRCCKQRANSICLH